METELGLPGFSSPLSQHLALIRVRESGVGPEQVRWIASDPEIFEVFYRQHIEEIQGFVTRRVVDPERAADLTAEVFLAAISGAHRYRPARGAPKAWLYGIARTVVAADRRQVARQQTGEERLRATALLDENDVTQIESRIEAAAKIRHLYQAMDRLTEKERAILEFVAIDELSLTEAATAAGVRPVTARVRLHRARRKLRAELEAASTEPKINKGDES
jgi:RNA polymerase sigma factor (sigma-70 family)